MISGYKKSPLHPAEDEFTPWYHLNLPQKAASPVPTDRKRDTGRTRLHLLEKFSGAAQKGIQHRLSYCLAPSGSSLEEERLRLLIFVTALHHIDNFTIFSR
jgi:hypothetical protein